MTLEKVRAGLGRSKLVAQRCLLGNYSAPCPGVRNALENRGGGGVEKIAYPEGAGPMPATALNPARGSLEPAGSCSLRSIRPSLWGKEVTAEEEERTKGRGEGKEEEWMGFLPSLLQ